MHTSWPNKKNYNKEITATDVKCMKMLGLVHGVVCQE